MKYLLTYLLLFYSVVTSAQQLNVSYSDEFKVVEHFNKDKVIKNAVSRNKFIFTATNDKVGGAQKWLFVKFYDAKFSIQIAKYDLNMNLLKEQKLEEGKKAFCALDPQLIQFDGKLYIGYYKPDEKDFVDYYISTVDEETLQLANPVKVLRMDVPNVGISKLEETLARTIVNYDISNDGNHLLFIGMTDKNKVGITILDENLKETKKDELELTGKGTYFLSSCAISNVGNVCATVYSDKGISTVISFSNPTGKMEHELSFTESDLKYGEIQCLLSGDETTFYFYSVLNEDKGDDIYCRGFWVAAMKNITKGSMSPVVYTFNENVTNMLCEKGGGFVTKKSRHVYSFRPRLKELNDGSLLMTGITQNTEIRIEQDLSNNRTKTYRTDLEGTLLFFFLNKVKPDYVFTLLPRRLVMSGLTSVPTSGIGMLHVPRLSKGYSGSYLFFQGDSILVIYNDVEENVAQPVSASPIASKSTSNLILAAAVITKKGEIVYRRSIGENQKGRYTYYLSETVLGQNNSLMIPIGQQGIGFNMMKEFYNYWCIFQTNYKY